MNIDTAGYHGDPDSEYQQRNLVQYEREYSGLDCDVQSRNVMVELEYLIEREFGAEQIEKGEVNMYKGTVKKW